MTDHIEERREQARQHRGVWYDSRADKFVAEVYSKGERHFLGHFPTADEAADAYAAARAELPNGRGGDDSFVRVFQSFLDTCEKDKSAAPLRDEVMTYKDQNFMFNGVVFRSMKGRKRPFYQWESNCTTCGAPYETLTATRPNVAKGITRNCEDHRTGARTGARAVVAQQARADVPQDWIDAANAALDTMSLLSDDFDLGAFLDQCRVEQPGLPRPFNRFVLESPQSPVVLRGGRLFPRNT